MDTSSNLTQIRCSIYDGAGCGVEDEKMLWLPLNGQEWVD